MYYLLIGFIAPAILFAILGFIACMRRNSIVIAEDDKDYQSIGSEDSQLWGLLAIFKYYDIGNL